MPIRIYALAKELKIDSKDLVDICNKAGITGKGSALASLNDDEADKVKSYLKGPTKKAPPAAPAAPTAPTPAAPSAPPSTEPKPFTRDDYMPTGNKDKIRVIDSSAKTSSEPRKKDEQVKREPKRKSPVINVAPLPEVKQPEPAAPPPEPKAQKPDIRLSKDAMTKKGPLEHLTSERKDKGSKVKGSKGARRPPNSATTKNQQAARRPRVAVAEQAKRRRPPRAVEAWLAWPAPRGSQGPAHPAKQDPIVAEMTQVRAAVVPSRGKAPIRPHPGKAK